MSKEINWDLTPEDRAPVDAIVERVKPIADAAGIPWSRECIAMDVTCVHLNGTPLRLKELAEAEDFDLNHDLFGIRRHLDRETGELGGFFVPRFAAEARQ